MLNNPNNRLLLGLVAFVIIAAFIASRIQTAGGTVRVQGISIPTQNGQWVAADLFRPVSATAESPAPLVVVVPGFQRSREALANTAIELSRRGIVAISIDPYAQGRSSSSTSRMAATTEGYGSFAVIDYAAGSENLNYVDKSRLAITGHSAGGNAAIRGANYFGREAQRTGEASRLHSVYMSGYVLTLRDEVLADVRSNIGVSYAFYDEGAYRNELGNGDMRFAPEALRVVNHGRDARLPRIEFGAGKIAALPGLAAAYGNRALLVTCARSLRAAATWSELEQRLRQAGLDWQSVSVDGEPSPQLVDAAVAQHAGSDIDVVIGIGGGSLLRTPDAGPAGARCGSGWRWTGRAAARSAP